MASRIKGTTDSRDRTKVFCACGLSRTFPFCDGSQKIAKSHLIGDQMRCGPARQVEPADVSAELAN